MASSTVEVQTPRVVSVSFTGRGTRLTVELDDGRTISAPVTWYPRLQHGKTRERNHWQLVGTGRGIHWPDLDEDISIDVLLTGKRSLESQKSLEQWLGRRSSKPKHA